MKIEAGIGYDDNGEIIKVEFPAKFEVCHDCEGHGYVLNPSMRNEVYTQDDMQECFTDDEREQYFKRGGIYDVVCPTCKGKNVVLILDEDACNADAELTKQLKEHIDFENDIAREAYYDRLTMIGENGGYG